MSCPKSPEPVEELPALLLERLRAQYLEQVVEKFGVEPEPAFFVNPLKCHHPENVLQELRELGLQYQPVPDLADTWTVPSEQRELLTHSPAAGDGRIYLQNASSRRALAAVSISPEAEVLDLCAAPGGKTLVLAGRLGTQGYLAAVESSRSRFFRMKQNLRRCGAGHVRTFLADGRSIGGKTPERFDLVVVDAPCSSEAVIRRNQPATWAHWGLGKIRTCARLQQQLLASAFQATKPGGTILYCTCTTATEENEDVVAHYASHLQSTTRIPPGGPYEPFFFAVLRKDFSGSLS